MSVSQQFHAFLNKTNEQEKKKVLDLKKGLHNDVRLLILKYLVKFVSNHCRISHIHTADDVY